MKVTTDKMTANCLAQLVAAHGIKRAVLSPGSRNAPLIVALSRQEGIKCYTIIDERSAAFFALGLSQSDGAPTLIVCTSGTALYNYAPAVAEAFYSKIPLIVVSADRPYQWIDQDDSQTLRQPGALSKIVKRSYNIPDECYAEGLWFARREINEAIITSISGRKGPVHINIQLEKPLGGMKEIDTIPPVKKVEAITADRCSEAAISKLAARVAESPSVLVVAGHHLPAPALRDALVSLGASKNVAIVTEYVSNMYSSSSITDFSELRSLKPVLLITLGGALVSASLKSYLRGLNDVEHWHVGPTGWLIDTYCNLSLSVDVDDEWFFCEIAKALCANSVNEPLEKHKVKRDYTDEFTLENVYRKVLEDSPAGWNLQLSNGLSVRYAQKCDCRHFHRIDCNRGVSGIEGSTSTAIGLSESSPETVTLLITGDMSAAYDVAALSCPYVSPNFKMVVVNNGGGGIFRTVESTSSLPELEERFVAKPKLPLEQLACGYGFAYFKAIDMDNLNKEYNRFVLEKDCPAILEIIVQE